VLRGAELTHNFRISANGNVGDTIGGTMGWVLAHGMLPYTRPGHMKPEPVPGMRARKR
jgi:hypothetical protein